MRATVAALIVGSPLGVLAGHGDRALPKEVHR